MPPTRLITNADRHAARLRGTLAGDLRRLREDSGVSQRALSAAAGVAQGHISATESGDRAPTLEIYARLAAALGADLAVRLYPNTGPAIRDRHQARILEALLGTLHRHWRRFPEVGVRHPARGWIDAVLHDPARSIIVAVEIQSELRRIEQLIRWSAEKAASLPSWSGWAGLGPEPEVSRLLIVRRTRSTAAAARDLGRQLRAAYPAHPADALAALRSDVVAWPGPALLWARIEAGRVRFMDP
jgi:transcriptional regulator with XRE-family HTH domain